MTKIENDLNYLEDFCVKSDDNNSTKQTVVDLYKVFNLKVENIFEQSD